MEREDVPSDWEFSIVESEESLHYDEPPGVCCMSMSAPRSSGRRERILLACVLDDILAVVEPAVFYRAERVHLLYAVEDSDDPRGPVRGELCDEAVSRLESAGM